MRRCFWIPAVLLLIALHASAQDAISPIRGYERGPGWQYVTFGSYPYEADGTESPVLWRVLAVEDGEALLFSEYVLDRQQAIFCDNQKDSESRAFRRILDFADSDLCAWMNDTMLTRMFDAESAAVLKETRYGRIYPLTREQYMTPEYGFRNAWDGVFKERQGYATPYARVAEVYPGTGSWVDGKKLYVDSEFGTSPHWAIYFKTEENGGAPSEDCIMLQLAGYDGHLSYGVYTRRDVGVRPAVTVDLGACRILGGDGSKADPYRLAPAAVTAENH